MMDSFDYVMMMIGYSVTSLFSVVGVFTLLIIGITCSIDWYLKHFEARKAFLSWYIDKLRKDKKERKELQDIKEKMHESLQ